MVGGGELVLCGWDLAVVVRGMADVLRELCHQRVLEEKAGGDRLIHLI